MRRLSIGLLVLASGLMVLVAGCGTGDSGPSQADTEASMSKFVSDWDFGDGQGTPDSAVCKQTGDSAFSCDVTFGASTYQVVATVQEDGKTVDLELAPDQVATCDEVRADAQRLQAFAAAPLAAGDDLGAYLKQGGSDPSRIRALFRGSADAFERYGQRLAAWQPQSEWGQKAKPVLLAAARRSEDAMRRLVAGETDLATAGEALTEASQTFDAQLAAVPCPRTS